MFRKDWQTFLVAFLILLFSFYAATDASLWNLFQNQKNLATGDIALSSWTLREIIDLISPPASENVRVFRELSAYPPWDHFKCRELLELIEHMNFLSDLLFSLGDPLYSSASSDDKKAYLTFEYNIKYYTGEMMRAFYDNCYDRFSFEEDESQAVRKGLDLIKDQLNWEIANELGIETDYTYLPNQNRYFNPTTCFPAPTAFPPQTTVLPPGPAFDPLGNPTHQLYLAFGLAGLSIFTAGVGWIVAVKVLGCTSSMWWGTSAIPIAAYLTPQAVRTISPIVTQKIAAGFAAIALADTLAAATQAKNPQYKPGDPLTSLIPLDPTEATTALQQLTGDANAWNQKIQQKYQSDCTSTTIPLCPTTTSGGASLLPPPTFTPTSTANACTPQSMAQAVTPTSTGAKQPSSKGPGFFNDVLKFYLDVPSDYQGFNFFDPNTPLSDLQSTGLVSTALMGPDGTAIALVPYRSPYTPLEYAMDLTAACQQYPGKTLHWALQFHFKASCGNVFMTFFGSYDCMTSATGPAGTGVVFTPPGQTPPDPLTELTKIISGKTVVTPSLPPISGPPVVVEPGPKTPACSGDLCKQPGGKACPNGLYCDAACTCQKYSCNPNGVKAAGEECDPLAVPTGCPVNYLCSNSCACVPSTYGFTSSTGASTHTLPSQQTEAFPTYERFTLVSGEPQQDVSFTYTNDLNEFAQGTFMRDPFAPRQIQHIDGTTTTYTYDSTNKLQTVVSSTGKTSTYFYSNNELASVTTISAQGSTYTTSYQYTPVTGYTQIDVFTTFPDSSIVQTPLYFTTLLRENGNLPFSRSMLPHTTLVFEKKISPSTFEEVLTRDPDAMGKGYTRITRYTTNPSTQKTLSVRRILDTNGDGQYERDVTFTYTDDSFGRLQSVTTDTGRTYTPLYDMPSSQLSSLLSIQDNEGDPVATQQFFDIGF